MARSSKRIRRARYASVIREVGVFAGAAGLTVLAVRDEIVLAALAGDLVHIRFAPRIARYRLAQIRTVPLRFVLRFGLERRESHLGGGIAAGVEAIRIER